MKLEDVKCCWLCVSIWSNMSTLPSNHRALLSRWCSELAVCWDMLFSTSEAPFLRSKNGCSNRDLLTRAFIHMFSKNPPWNQSMLMAFVVFCMRGAPHKQLRWLKGHFVGQIFSPQSDLSSMDSVCGGAPRMPFPCAQTSKSLSSEPPDVQRARFHGFGLWRLRASSRSTRRNSSRSSSLTKVWRTNLCTQTSKSLSSF